MTGQVFRYGAALEGAASRWATQLKKIVTANIKIQMTRSRLCIPRLHYCAGCGADAVGVERAVGGRATKSGGLRSCLHAATFAQLAAFSLANCIPSLSLFSQSDFDDSLQF